MTFVYVNFFVIVIKTPGKNNLEEENVLGGSCFRILSLQMVNSIALGPSSGSTL